MHNKILSFFYLLITCIIILTPATHADDPYSANQAQQPAVMQNLSQMPLSFTENQGQWDQKVLFRADAGGAIMWFSIDGVYYQFTKTFRKKEPTPDDLFLGQLDRFDRKPDSTQYLLIKASFVGANPNPRIKGEDMVDYKCNYFLGNEPAKWRTDVPNYGAVVYQDIYPGIDLKYRGDGRQMKYEFIVSPGIDPSQIKMRYEGAKSLSVNDAGELVVETNWNKVTEQKPVVYQTDRGERKNLNGMYVRLPDNSFGFEITGGYDLSLPLIIDPTLVYSTYFGGGVNDGCVSIAIDGTGHACIAGWTYGGTPTFNAFQGTIAGSCDAYITKFSSAGNALLFSTYLGGTGGDWGFGITLDASGNVYVTGSTQSANFPIFNALQSVCASCPNSSDAFVAKFNSTGNVLLYSTYLGGFAGNDGYGIAVDAEQNAYVTGCTNSSHFPTVNAFQSSLAGPPDAFVAKLNPLGNALVYSTYLGGAIPNNPPVTYGCDCAYGISVDASGQAYVTGETASRDFPTVNPFQATIGTGYDGFVTKLNAAGNHLVYSTYLGGNNDDLCYGNAIDNEDHLYVCGGTLSTNFPTVNPYQASLRGSQDAFVTKFNTGGNGLIYSTYLGGSSWDFGQGIDIDDEGYAYVTGFTSSTNFPTANPLQATNAGGEDAFLTKLTLSGNVLRYSTYFGGGADDGGRAVATDHYGNVYVEGNTSSSNFPITPGAYDPSFNGAYDAVDCFVAMISDATNNQAPTAVIDNINPSPGYQGQPVSFTGHGVDSDGYIIACDWRSSVNGFLSSQSSFSTTILSPGNHTISFKVQDNWGDWSNTVTQSLHIDRRPTAYIDNVSPNPVNEGGTVNFSGHGADPDGSVVGYRWQSDIDGVLSSQASFSKSNLSPGTHSISFQVQNNEGGWSDEAFVELTVIPANGLSDLLKSLDSLKVNVARKMLIMTADMAQCQAWVYKGLFESDALNPMVSLMVSATTEIPDWLSFFLKCEPADWINIAIGKVTYEVLTGIDSNIRQTWRNATNNIFADPGLDPNANANDLRPEIESILLNSSQGPYVDARIIRILSQIDALKTQLTSNPIPPDFPYETITYNINKLVEDIKASNSRGEDQTVSWYCPFGHTDYPEASKAFLMNKLGDWLDNPSDFDASAYAKQLKNIYVNGYGTEREYIATGYPALLSVGVGALVGKIAIACFFPGIGTAAAIAEVFLGIGFYGIAAGTAETTLEGVTLVWRNNLALSNVGVWGSYSQDLAKLDTMVVDVTRYVSSSVDPGTPNFFPFSQIELCDLNIPDAQVPSGITTVTREGSITLKNTGSNSAKVSCLIDMVHNSDCISVSGLEQPTELAAGQTTTLPFWFTVPNPEEYGHRDCYFSFVRLAIGTNRKWRRSFSYSLGDFLQDCIFCVTSTKKSGFEGDQNITAIMEDSVLDGQSQSTTYMSTQYQTRIYLYYDGGELDLHIYDNMGRHTGFNYTTGEVDSEIPYSTYTGSSTLPEIITIDRSAGQTYTVGVRGVSTDGYEPFYVSAIETPERPGTMDVLPFNAHFVGIPGDTSDELIPIAEIGGHHHVIGVQPIPSELVGSTYTIPSSDFSFEMSTNIIPAGGNLLVPMHIAIPVGAPSGEYTGNLQVNSTNGGSEQVPITLRVDNPPSNPSTPSGATLVDPCVSHDYTTLSTDLESDSIYYIFDWGDSAGHDWHGPLGSGVTCVVSHRWRYSGTYCVKVQAMDPWGLFSEWSDSLLVTVGSVNRGDANGDGVVDVGDVVYLINYLFKAGTAPNPLGSGDTNCDGTVDIGDVVYLINYLFKQGPRPCIN